MKKASEWLEEYGVSHQNKINKALHWVCVPSIMLSLIGLLWSIPFPIAITSILPDMIAQYTNWGTIFIIFCVVYYFILSIPLGFGMLFIGMLLLMALQGLISLESSSLSLWQMCIIIFVIAWIGQFIGHKIEGRKPSFFQDIQFLLIGPMWLLSFIYRKLSIKY